MKTLFGKTINVMQKALELRSRKNAVLASNIANVDTPGFREKDLDFRRLMDSYMKDLEEGKESGARGTSGGAAPFIPPGRDGLSELQLSVTDPGHMTPGHDRNPAVILESDERGVPNNVDLDEQMARLSENNLQYQAAIQLLVKKFELLKEAATEGGRQ